MGCNTVRRINRDTFNRNNLKKETTMEVKNCRREWNTVEPNKQHCRYLCTDNICTNTYCTWYNPNNLNHKRIETTLVK